MLITVKYNLNMTPEGLWRFQAWISECGDDDDPNIFVHQLQPDIPEAPSGRTRFADIAGRSDMEEYPVDAPSGGLSFFRKSSMDISLEDSEEMWRSLHDIINEIDKLVRTYEVIT